MPKKNASPLIDDLADEELLALVQKFCDYFWSAGFSAENSELMAKQLGQRAVSEGWVPGALASAAVIEAMELKRQKEEQEAKLHILEVEVKNLKLQLAASRGTAVTVSAPPPPAPPPAMGWSFSPPTAPEYLVNSEEKGQENLKRVVEERRRYRRDTLKP